MLARTSLVVCLCTAATLSAQDSSVPVTANATRAVVNDALRPSGGSHAMYWDTQELWVFASDGRFTQDAAAGTARFTGRFVSKSDSNRVFDAEVDLGGLTFAAPMGSPKTNPFFASSLAANGGPIDPATWYYYATTTGTLTGRRDLAGAELSIVRRGAAFQVGYGANQKNDNYGASGWLDFTVVSQPTTGAPLAVAEGDFNLDIVVDCVSAEGSVFEPGFWPGTTTYAFRFANLGCGSEYDFIAPAFVRADDGSGTVRVAGEIAARSNPNCRFVVDLEFSGRSKPGDANYPPTGSPLTSFASSFLEANGGPIDPSVWCYFDTITGRLDGRGDLVGARLNVALRGPAAQFGYGASRRIEEGAAFDMDITVTSQPNSGPALTDTDVDVDFTFSVASVPQIAPQMGARQKLQTVTDGCFVITGCGLDQVTAVNFGGTSITSMDPCDLGRGYFVIRSSEEICIYPPNCLTAGGHRITVEDAMGNGTGRLMVDLEDPVEPTLVTVAELQTGKTQRFYVHQGTGPNTCPNSSITYLILSSSPLPTIIPGFVNAQLGNMASSYLCGPGATNPGCIEIGGYTIPPSFAGTRLYSQSIFLCVPNVILPVPITNRAQTDYR